MNKAWRFGAAWPTSQTQPMFNNLAILAQFQGDYRLSRAYHKEALAIRRGLGGKWAIAISLNNLGTTILDQGDYATARVPTWKKHWRSNVPWVISGRWRMPLTTAAMRSASWEIMR